MDAVTLRRLLRRQDGVVSRLQLRGLGAADHDIARLRRRRALVPVLPGVYVDHTGPLTDHQRAWAAVLYAAPAALCRESALDESHDPVHVAIDASRRIADRPGLRVTRVPDLADRVRWNLGPPRMHVEEAVLQLVDRAGRRPDVVRILTEPVNDGLTTAARLRLAVEARPRLRHRRWTLRVLADVEQGTCSVLEHGYLTRVERAHGLPRASRQSSRVADSGRQFRDVEYDAFGLVVELDGRVGHDTWDASGRDADRDLDDHAAGREVVRLRHPQVFDRACRTAERIAAILRRRGWPGRIRRCGPDCSLPAP